MRPVTRDFEKPILFPFIIPYFNLESRVEATLKEQGGEPLRKVCALIVRPIIIRNNLKKNKTKDHLSNYIENNSTSI